MQHKPLGAVGAAMRSDALPEHRDWLIAGQRDLELQDPFHPEVLDNDWSGTAARIRDSLAGHGGRLSVHGPFVNLSIMGFDPRARELTALRLRQGLEFAAAVGADQMVIHSPYEFFGDPFIPHSPEQGLKGQLDLVGRTLGSVVPLAEEVGCTLVVENVFDLNPAPLLALVRSFDSERVRVSLDVGHAYIAHRRGGPSPDQWVREAGSLLVHLHLQDTDGCSDRHWAPGRGNINWYALFEALARLEHRPRLILEVGGDGAIRQGAEWLIAQGYVS